jgi:hypothetical protein
MKPQRISENSGDDHGSVSINMNVDTGKDLHLHLHLYLQMQMQMQMHESMNFDGNHITVFK